MHLKRSSLIIIYYLVIVIFWWSYLALFPPKDPFYNYLYQFGFGLLPLFGGIWGIASSRKWGVLSSQVGSAVFYISLGILFWGLGQMCWAYYNIFQNVDIPYPSWADTGYLAAIPFWFIGMLYLFKATGAKFSLKKPLGQFSALFILILVALVSYYLLINVARGGIENIDFSSNNLKLFFDLAYPLGDLTILAMTALLYGLSFRYLGGKFKGAVIILLLGFVLMYITDFTFSVVTTNKTYYNGHFVDLLFPMVMAILVFGVDQLNPDSLNRES